MKLTILFNKMVVLLMVLPIIQSQQILGQLAGQVSLEEAQQIAEKNYPLSRQRNILKETENLSIENLNRNYYPQLTWYGQFTHQSDVPQVNVSIPGFKIEPPGVNQYKLYTDLSQVVYDAGVTREQKKLQQQSTKVEEHKLEVEMYKLRERVNQVYLSIILLEEQARLTELLKKDIQSGFEKTEAQVKNGVALRSNLDVLKAESLKAEQRLIELQTTREGFVQALGLLLNEKLENNTSFVHPSSPAFRAEIHRPELNLFNQQFILFDQQKGLITAKTYPKINLFGQAGYARPGLNLLKNEAAFFYLGGIRIYWNMSSLYTYKNEKRLLDLNKTLTNLQKETFILNTNTQLIQQHAEITKLEKLIQADKEIIGLRENIVHAAGAQLENKVITTHDYLREINAADQSRQGLILHELQLLQAQINYQTIAGNQ